MIKHWYWVTAFIVIGILLAVGILFLVTRPPNGIPVLLLPAPSPSPITVYVSGEVNQAGLISLAPGSRVNDAILAAGGFSMDADSTAVNLAAVLADGKRVIVPAILLPQATTGSTRSVDPPINSVNTDTSLVNLNTATLEQLDTLPGVGPVIAQKIIDYRQTNGPFPSIEDIMKVSGIKQATFEKLKDLITVGTSP